MILQLTNIVYENISADLYLGSWCHDTIDGVGEKTHKYHWSNLNKFQKDSDLIFSIYEDLLGRLSKKLNTLHDLNKDVSYWQKIVGPWLLFFVSIVFDRFEILNSLKNKNRLVTYLPNYKLSDWIPLDFVDFESLAASEEWNLYIYSEIIKELEIVKYKETQTTLINKDLYKRKNDKFIKKVVKNTIYFTNKMVPERFKDVCLIETNLKPLKLYNINLRLRKYPFQYYIREVTHKSKVNYPLRNMPTDDIHQGKDSEVVKLLCCLIVKNLPIAYLESFKLNRINALKSYPKNPKFILTSSAYFSNELFKIWTAEKSLINKKVCISVHGAHHSTALFNHAGKFTEIISDTFFTWGWKKNILSSSKLSELKKSASKFKYNKTEVKICFVAYSANKYSDSISARPTSSNFIDTLKIQKNFFRNVNIVLRRNITIRLKNTSRTWNLEEFYKNEGVNNFSYLQAEGLKKLVGRNSLFIFAYESTMFFELLTLNIPSIIFFEEKFWQLNKIGRKDYDDLSKVNIYHQSPDKLSRFVNEMNIDEINEWWFDDNTQKIKDNFLEKHARSNSNYLNEWISTIKKNMD